MAVWQFVGKGKVKVRKAGTTDTLRELGNVMDVTITATELVKEQKNMQDAGGGLAASLRRVDKAEVAITLGEFSPENLAMANLASVVTTTGTAAEVGSGTILEPEFPATPTTHRIEAYVNSSTVWEVHFEGLNELNDGKYFKALFHRVRLGVAAKLDLIGDDITTLPIKGLIERDPTKTGAGTSKFFYLDIEE